MWTAIFLVTVVALAVFVLWIAWEVQREKESRPKARPPRLPDGYRAEWLDGDQGRGWTIKRASDGQSLRWQTLPKRDGLESMPVVGTSYREAALQDTAFTPGRPLALVREPENEHDENATAVYDADERVQVGYVPSEDAGKVARRLDNGEDIRAYSMWESTKGRRRVGLRMLLVRDV